MELAGLFASEYEPEITELLGIRLKAVQEGAGQIDLAMPLSIWPAAVSLSKYLLTQDYRTWNCIELGAGTGLVSLCLLKGKVIREGVITDGEERAVELIRENVGLNEGVQAEVRRLEWSQCPGELEGRFDLVLGSDVM